MHHQHHAFPSLIPAFPAEHQPVSSELAAMPSQDPDETLQTLNSIVLNAATRAFPRQAAPKSSPPVDFVPLWQLRSSLRKHWRRDLQGLFEATILQRSDALLSVGDIPQVCIDWATRLSQRCSLCNNWAMDKSSVKCHLIRKHAREWHTHSQEVSRLCISHKHLLQREHLAPTVVKWCTELRDMLFSARYFFRSVCFTLCEWAPAPSRPPGKI